MSGYLLRPCKSTAAFEAIPRAKSGNLNLNLNSVFQSLSELGYELVCDARVLIIIKKDSEVSVYPSGKLLIKTDSRSIAEKTMNEIFNKLDIS